MKISNSLSRTAVENERVKPKAASPEVLSLDSVSTSQLDHNCVLLSPEGHMLCMCGTKKANRYTQKILINNV